VAWVNFGGNLYSATYSNFCLCFSGSIKNFQIHTRVAVCELPTKSFGLLSLHACKGKISFSNYFYKSQNGEVVGEIEPKLAHWHNLTRKGRSSREDDRTCTWPKLCVLNYFHNTHVVPVVSSARDFHVTNVSQNSTDFFGVSKRGNHASYGLCHAFQLCFWLKQPNINLK
jgi:hypothetical protein